jgi:hypothetical protein
LRSWGSFGAPAGGLGGAGRQRFDTPFDGGL